MMSSMSKFVLEERVASCSSFVFMYSHALSTGIAVNSDTTSKETKTSLSSILISDNSLENCKQLATEYPLRIGSGERISVRNLDVL